MTIASFLKIPTALPVAAMLALAGCGGGGGTALNMMKDEEPPMMPAPLTLANGLSIGDVAPLLADGTMTREMALEDGTTFRAYSASIIREFNRGDPNTPSKFSIPDGGAQVKSIRGDGDYGFHVTYMDAEGDETTVHFSKDDYNEDIPNTYEKMGYWIFASLNPLFNGENWGGGTDILGIFGGTAPRTGPGQTRFRVVYGLETPDSFIETFEVGDTAEYRGEMSAEAYTRGETENNDGRTHLRGIFTANYEYTGQGAGTVTGMITDMTVQLPSSGDVLEIDDTISIVGEARGAQISATLTGTGGSEMDGYTGGAVGAAFGPEAQSAVAVFSMERDGDHPHHVLIGSMGGRLQQ